MATVGIWKVESSLNQVIKYVSNKEKIDLSNFQDLDNSLEYIKDEFKTEEKLFISGINCDPDTSYNDMVRTKKRFNKENGILGFHAYQSFKEGEVTPDIAHEIGVKLAEEIWDDYEVVVATHQNTNHIHNHFIINSVSSYDKPLTFNIIPMNECILAKRKISIKFTREHEMITFEKFSGFNCELKNLHYTFNISQYNEKIIEKMFLDSDISLIIDSLYVGEPPKYIAYETFEDDENCSHFETMLKKYYSTGEDSYLKIFRKNEISDLDVFGVGYYPSENFNKNELLEFDRSFQCGACWRKKKYMCFEEE